MTTAEFSFNVSNTEISSSSPIQFIFNTAASNLVQSPLSYFLDYLIIPQMHSNLTSHDPRVTDTVRSNDHEEVSIRIVSSREQDLVENRAVEQGDEGEGSSLETPNFDLESENLSGEYRDGVEGNSSYQRYDFQQIGRWLEQIVPFSLLLLVVFIRQHLLGFFGTIWISVILFKSNEILRKQTALKVTSFFILLISIHHFLTRIPFGFCISFSSRFKHVKCGIIQGDRKTSVLLAISAIFIVHVASIYWLYPSNDLVYPLILLPTQEIPPFWHAAFIIVVNDTMVRQVAMVFKCLLLIYFKNTGCHNYRKQGQMLTLVEYILLLYRALLPTPVWYSFFLNKEYGNLFSAFITGFYLTFKLTSISRKVRLLFAALMAVSRKEVHYGLYATSEQVKLVGDLCAICQEKMKAPILLSCKHIFCEDCVSQWFERERTCPLCRSTVKPANITSYDDGSTSLLFQLF